MYNFGWYGTWHKTFPHLQHPQSYAGWKQKFYELVEDGEIFIAEAEKQIAGFAVVLTKEQCLSQLFIDENYQGLGIGSALINIAKRLSQKIVSSRTESLHITRKSQSSRIL